MIEKLLLFWVQCWKFVTTFKYRECYGSDEQSRKLLHTHENLMQFVFVTIRICSLNMLVYSNNADISKYERRWLCFEWRPLALRRVIPVVSNHKYKKLNIQPQHNYVILPGIIQRINYMFQPLLGRHQVVLSSQCNSITESGTRHRLQWSDTLTQLDGTNIGY
jgi:hypothetical protein